MYINRVDIKNKKIPNWIFNIRRVKFDHIDYDETIPHQHNFYEILFLEEGEGVHLIDDKKHKVKNNTIHFLSPSHVHQLTLDDTSKGIVCMFKEDFFYSNNEGKFFLDEIYLFSNWIENPVLQFDKDAFKELKNILNPLLLEFEEHNFRKNEILFSYLKIFLIKVARLSVNLKSEGEDSKKKILVQFVSLLEEHISNNYQVQFYASQLNISSTYLNQIVKNIYGKTVSDYINERLILEAKRILCFSPKSIKEIAYELGFNDPSYFSRFFKKQVGSTPIQYRNSLQK